MGRISIAAGVAAGWLALASGLVSPSVAQDAALEAEVRAALTAVFDALASGDPENVEPLLAPEYQILRSDGAGYDKDAYLARSIPQIESEPTFRDLVLTRNGDIVVARMRIEIEEYLDGKKAESVFPHLIVFRITPAGWQVVAAANFAKLAE